MAARLSALAGRVRCFFDKDHEPLRRKIYATVGTLLTLAVAAGVITGDDAFAISGVIGTVLLIPAAEIARQNVTPVTAKHRSGA